MVDQAKFAQGSRWRENMFWCRTMCVGVIAPLPEASASHTSSRLFWRACDVQKTQISKIHAGLYHGEVLVARYIFSTWCALYPSQNRNDSKPWHTWFSAIWETYRLIKEFVRKKMYSQIWWSIIIFPIRIGPLKVLITVFRQSCPKALLHLR